MKFDRAQLWSSLSWNIICRSINSKFENKFLLEFADVIEQQARPNLVHCHEKSTNSKLNSLENVRSHDSLKTHVLAAVYLKRVNMFLHDSLVNALSKNL